MFIGFLNTEFSKILVSIGFIGRKKVHFRGNYPHFESISAFRTRFWVKFAQGSTKLRRKTGQKANADKDPCGSASQKANDDKAL